MLKVKFGQLKKKCSFRYEKLKTNRASETEEQRKERLRIRCETEKHEKQRLATPKRLKRGDVNELKRNLRLEKVVASKQLRLAMETEEERKARLEYDTSTKRLRLAMELKKSKTGEDGSYCTALVNPE